MLAALIDACDLPYGGFGGRGCGLWMGWWDVVKGRVVKGRVMKGRVVWCYVVLCSIVYYNHDS